MNLPPDLEASILAMPGVTVNGKPVSRGEDCAGRTKSRRAGVHPSAFRPPAIWLIGVRTDSRVNHVPDKRTLIGMGGRQRREVVRQLCREHAALARFVDRLRDGEPVRVELTRLGPGRPDQHSLLGDSLKAVVDAIADVLATDDGNPLIQWSAAAERSDRYGVRVVLS